MFTIKTFANICVGLVFSPLVVVPCSENRSVMILAKGRPFILVKGMWWKESEGAGTHTSGLMDRNWKIVTAYVHFLAMTLSDAVKKLIFSFDTLYLCGLRVQSMGVRVDWCVCVSYNIISLFVFVIDSIHETVHCKYSEIQLVNEKYNKYVQIILRYLHSQEYVRNS